jgi:hypothetical protein
LKTSFLEKLVFLTRIPEQFSLHFYNFPVILYRFYNVHLVNPRSVDVVLQKGPPIKNWDYNRVPGGRARLACGEGWPDSGEWAARVGFGLTLNRLVGLVRRETALATVGGEGGGGRPWRPQCRQVGESTWQSTCTGGSKGCGWRLLRRLNSSRGGGPRGALASSARRQRRTGRSGAVWSLSKCEGGGVRGALGGPNGTHACQVTTPPEIIPYYRLNHSIWSLSDNKKASRWVLPGLHPVNHLETQRGSNECIKTPSKESPECLTNYPSHPRRGHYYKHSSLTWK